MLIHYSPVNGVRCMFSGKGAHRIVIGRIASAAKGLLFAWLLLAASAAMTPAKASDGAVELSYDDGTADYFMGFSGYTDVFAVKFSLPEGWSTANILEAKYYVRSYNNLIKTASVHVYHGDPVEGNLVDLMNPATIKFPTVPGEPKWISVSLDATVDGDFYVALESTDQFGLGVDTTEPHAKQSAGRWGGNWILPTDPWPYWLYIGGDYMIRVVLETANQPPVADAGPDQTLEATGPEGAAVTLDGSGSYDPDGDALTYSWSWDGGSASGETAIVALPLGVTTVALAVDDGNGGADTDTVEVAVQDTTPPEITASVSPDTVWPPNHNYVDVEAIVTTSDVSGTSVTVTLVSVASSEPEDAVGMGDGNTVDDIIVIDDFHFKLRAERDGAGVGRTYTITYAATDASGNGATIQVTVTVPRDNRKST